MPLIVVDMGAAASANQTAWVIEACSEALSEGRCVPEGSAESSPQAVAIVRVRDAEGRSVRIEIGRRREERAAWSVRELEFERADPPAERWRSVGLALATLVGEIEDSTAAAAETPSEAAVPSAAAVALGAASGRVEDDASFASDESDEPLPRPALFIGAGAFAGQGRALGDPVRWGGAARGTWLSRSGIQASLTADYSTLALEPGLELDWLRLSAGAGYRYFASDRWSFGAALQLGVRGLGVDAEDASGRRTERDWSLLGAGSADIWWQVASFGGLWLGLELSSIGRRTRLIARDGRVESELPLGDATGVLGLWLTPWADLR